MKRGFQRLTNFKDIEIPEEYQEKSRQITMLWEAFIDNAENLDRLVVDTRNLLEAAGLSRTEAMKKIAQDHRHLKGFSLASLYRLIPLEDKRQKTSYDSKQQFSNENYEKSQEIETNIVNIPQTTPNIIDIEPTEPEQQEEQEPLAPYTASVDYLKREQEYQDTLQLLREERAKTAELEERLELMQREHEAKEAASQDKINELDALTDKLSAQLQEKSRQLTSLTMQQDNAIPEPPTEQNYTVEADIPYNSKKLPVVVRCFISGNKVGWIDRDLYKARYGKEPQEE